eukprot:CAMPEP_0180077916 /NCGR_PEP_ID=MMETSP0985-20121206/15990_1 /TAXON_ID=483367 /ORGANISM="non described non described, Strain CCMP 2436" /LENGTH=107 /DNA_ID=CAMNT_0022010357 /DNA_START=312 /DNA_END=635 /DNA_ORIENTATION=+
MVPLPSPHASQHISHTSWLAHVLHRYLYPTMGTTPQPSQVIPGWSPKYAVFCSSSLICVSFIAAIFSSISLRFAALISSTVGSATFASASTTFASASAISSRRPLGA